MRSVLLRSDRWEAHIDYDNKLAVPGSRVGLVRSRGAWITKVSVMIRDEAVIKNRRRE